MKMSCVRISTLIRPSSFVQLIVFFLLLKKIILGEHIVRLKKEKTTEKTASECNELFINEIE